MRFGWLLLMLSLPLFLGAVAGPRYPSIIGLRIHLFCDATGELTPDVTSMPDIYSWDLATGEGGAPCASHAAMLVYIVQGEPNTSLGQYQLSVVATKKAGNSIGSAGEIARQSLQLGATNEEGQVFVPFLLNNLPCDRIQVGAGIGSASPALVTPLPFRCGA